MVRNVSWAVCVLALLALLAGCGASNSGPGPMDAAGTVDESVQGDGATDLGSGDGNVTPPDGSTDGAAPMDTPGMDGPTDTGPTDTGPADIPPVRCHGDTDCMGIEGARVCDLLSGLCVQCVPTADTCPVGFYCTDARACVAGCRNASDCVASDAGMRCDTARRVCVGCLADTDCGPGTVCTAGACVPGCNATHACPAPQSCCTGACVDTNSVVTSCGTCTRACGTAHAAPACTMGMCDEHCAAGYGDCDGDPTNGCETGTVDNAAHCGACGTSCALAHATSTCAGSACAVVACSDGYQDCDHNPTTGCEAAVQSDTANCGMCGTACLAGQLCTSGACACPAGQTLCRMACTNVVTDVSNCGGCNIACPAGQMCLGGHCSSDITTYSTATAVPPSVTWVEACALPGAVHELMGIDDGMGPTVAMPFAFRFFEGTYTQVTPSADGYLGFGATGTSWGGFSSYTVPSTSSPAPAFFIFSVDLYQRTGGECFATVGTAPNRSFVWENSDAYKYFDSSTHLTFEALLNEGSNTIDVLYQTLSGTGTSGDTTLVGMQNTAATRSYTYEHNTAGTLRSGLRLRFTPNG